MSFEKKSKTRIHEVKDEAKKATLESLRSMTIDYGDEVGKD